MGLFDWLTGSGSKPEPTPKKQPEPAAVTELAMADIQPETVDAVTVSAELNPEIIAAIAVSLNCVLDTSIRVERPAGITVGVVHHHGSMNAVNMKPALSAWALAGRQKLMDSRQFA